MSKTAGPQIEVIVQKNVLPHAARLLYGLAAFVIIVAGMKATADLLNLLFLSVLLALTMSPLLNALIRRGMQRTGATVATIFLVFAGGLLVCWFLYVSITHLIATLPAYEPRMAAIRQQLREFMESRNIAMADIINWQVFSPQRLIAVAGWFLGAAVQGIGASLIVLVLVAMMLIEAPDFGVRLGPGTGKKEEGIVHRFGLVGQAIKRYVAITGWLGLLNAGMNLILLLSLGVDGALLWAVLSFLLCFVPVVGNMLALAPPAIMALLESGWQRAVMVVVGYLIINNVIDYLVRPRFLKQGVGLSPLVIVISLLFWGWVLGPIGILVAVPLTLLLRKLVLEHFRETRAIAAAMGT